VSRQKRLVGKWQERFLTANWRQERGPGCVGEGDRGGFAKAKQTRSAVLDGGFHTIKSTVDGSACGLLGCGLRSAGLATLAAVVRAAVGGRAGVQCRRAVACAGRLSLLLSSLRAARASRHQAQDTSAPSLRARGERTCPSLPHSLIPDHPKPAVLLLGSAPVQPRAHAIRRRPDCRRVPRLYPSASARRFTASLSRRAWLLRTRSNQCAHPSVSGARLGQYRCASVSLEPQANSDHTDRATSNRQQPPAASSPKPPAPSRQPPASSPQAGSQSRLAACNAAACV
jgi:hypothetical protein